MGDSSGKLPHRLHLLCLAELLAKEFSLGDIFKGPFVTPNGVGFADRSYVEREPHFAPIFAVNFGFETLNHPAFIQQAQDFLPAIRAYIELCLDVGHSRDQDFRRLVSKHTCH